jgi:hypothetical protein
VSNDYLPAAPGLTDSSNLDVLQQHFLAILPRIETHARIRFRHLRCPGKRADAIAEVVALSWRWFLRIFEQGKDVDQFVSALATLAARHVRCGRRLCGAQRARDAMSPRAQHRHGFHVEPLPCSTRRSHVSRYGDPHSQDQLDAFEERLCDNTQSPVPDQAAFRIDYPAWLVQLDPRNRAIAQDMALDHDTTDLAHKHQLSPGRISQLRRELNLDWRCFHGEPSA